MENKNKIIGIIGGMGPFASAYFYKLLLKKSSDNYGARNNDDFPEILIDSVPVPYFISDTVKMEEARKMLVSRVKRMDKFGVGCLGMVCNTGHLLYDDLNKASKSKFLSMINLVADEVKKRRLKKVCVLATKTTIKFNLYGKVLKACGIEVVYPNLKLQGLHESIIRNMVAGKRVEKEIEELEISTNKLIRDNNLNGVILGCTELPLVFPKDKFTNVIDCIDVLADKMLEKYYN
jgi:aspartate racemase